jgi:uncharacterized protein (DUF58 family)
MGHIDWRQSAKSDRVYLRQTEWEAAQSVWLWRDGSDSMRYRSGRAWPTKLETAELLLLAIASLLVRGGERVHLLGQAPLPAAGGTAMHHLAHVLASSASVRGVSLPAIEPLPRYARVVLFGDFLVPLNTVLSMVQGFAHRGVRGHLIHIIDPAEETLPFSGRVVFFGCEGDDEALFGRTETIRAAYREKFLAHQEGLKALARAADWTLLTHHCDQPPPLALLALYLSLSGSAPG